MSDRRNADQNASVFAVTDVNTEDFAPALSGDPSRDNHRTRHNLAQSVVADVKVGGVEVHVRECGVTKGAVAERVNAFIKPGADARHLRFGDAGLDTESGDKVINGSCRHTVDVSLHDDRVQGLVDATARVQQAGEVRPGPQLRDAELQVTGFG